MSAVLQGPVIDNLFSLGKKTMPRACGICGKSGATHVKPNGEAIHLKCGQAQWNRELGRAKRRGKA